MTTANQINSIEEAMEALGVTERTLSAEEKLSLDEKGYVIFTDVLGGEELEAFRAKYEELMEKEGANAGKEVHQEAGTRRLSDLVNKGECFDRVYTNPKLLAAVYHVLKREFKLSSLNARDAIPGAGLQPLHADWGSRREDEPFHVCNSIWLIDDFTADNGATRVVPGTHKLGGNPREHGIDPLQPHPREELIVAPAGSVGVFNSHLWHGGTVNRTSKTRRAMHCYFTAREHGQQLNQAEYIRKSTYDRISPAARYILDV
ncbi:phytanoyl-CoA dioxygenase family protein [Paenibacillus thermotolerans]|uniref:phytanoyl-CoA dioxygenase family protein n=1 Tax=Paenibacillus thermotolerans TaxID=3027807 RepID=UPI002367CCEC|nr:MULTISPECIES: phytanoyl-CoA dioxygenase family protein [unclassified Paenibacillus]